MTRSVSGQCSQNRSLTVADSHTEAEAFQVVCLSRIKCCAGRRRSKCTRESCTRNAIAAAQFRIILGKNRKDQPQMGSDSNDRRSSDGSDAVPLLAVLDEILLSYR